MLSLPYSFVSLAQLTDAVRHNLPFIPRNLDLVVGIPQSGMIPAYAIGLYLNLPVIDVPGFLENRRPSHGITRHLAVELDNPGSARRILLVDDSYSTGISMRVAVKSIRDSGFSGEIVTCAVIVMPKARAAVDLHFMEVPFPRIFEWNVFHHPMIEDACLDFDGVLCVDPTEEENDDGPRYREFLLNARPLHLPSRVIGDIVSARLEKYRPETEEWLKQHGVQFKALHLLNLPSKAERIRTQAHRTHKVNVYRAAKSWFFIESEESQAVEIANRTGKPVLSLETMRLHHGNGIYLNHAPTLAHIKWRKIKERLNGFLSPRQS